jgi:hypothetical protein
MAHQSAPPVVNMTKQQCAEYCNVGTTTIQRWRETKGFPYIQIDGITRYPLGLVEAWLAERAKADPIVEPTPDVPVRRRKQRAR